MHQSTRVFLIGTLLALSLTAATAWADTPAVSYIFPAGGQRGATVKFRVGGIFLHKGAAFEMLGPAGVAATPRIERTTTIWFEGPVIPMPASQAAEDYPKDYAGSVNIAADAPLGARAWRVCTSQGAVSARNFIVGELPEILEEEIEGSPVAVPVTLPVTINGRIFPREDIDLWSFEGRAGQPITCAVLAAQLGSPLEARVEILDPQGRRIAESYEDATNDAIVRFVPPVDGVYQARIQDMNYGGLQSYVYRLTITAGPYVDRIYPLGGRKGTSPRFELVGQALPAEPVDIALPADGPARYVSTFKSGTAFSNPFAIELDSLPEVLEAEPNDTAEQVKPVAVPAVLNGRIGKPGDQDVWAFNGTKGAIFDLDVRAARLGSPLDAVLTVLDATGKELAKADDIAAGQTDATLRFTIPADGIYYARVEERLTSRGGPAFAYRLRVAPIEEPGFRLNFVSDVLTLVREKEAKLKVKVDRRGTFTGEVKLELEGLPAGVTATNLVIAPAAKEVDVALKADASATIRGTPIKVRGTAMVGDAPVVQQATVALPTAGNVEVNSVLMAVSLAPAFKVKGIYESKYAQRGANFSRHFVLERGGFNGPLEISIADKQGRHLQGVAGVPMTVPAGATEFDYSVFLPPFMEIGRTSRSLVMATAIIDEPDGSKHEVSFTSTNQNEQIIVLIDPGQLNVEIDRKSMAVAPAGSVSLTVRVNRGQGAAGPVKIELVVPKHIHGIESSPLTIPADQTTIVFPVKFTAGEVGPLNMPLLVRATIMQDDKRPIIAETPLELVPK